ncbi:MAG: ribosome maturation factor RimP [Oscillospiraceae bacterium]|nr:ribosome maturation factor RimP [Oscillospiraceae bacterium]
MAKGRKAVDIVEELVRPVCEEMGLILWDVRFEKEGPDWYLRVFIDRPDEGVYIQDCEDLSRAVDPLLDEADPISQNYIFEVSSAGLGRRLTKPFHFESKMGEEVLARYIRAKDGVKEVRGILRGQEEGFIDIETAEGIVKIDLKETSYVKLCDDEDLF